MNRPPARPEGALIRLAREAVGMTLPEAAQASGISKARWSQVETGYETRVGVTKVVQAKAATLAHMAHAVGITPERLETEGKRPDAAVILREIIRSEPAPPVRPVSPPPAEPGEPRDTAWTLFPGSPEKRALWRLRDGDGNLLPERIRAELIAALDEARREALDDEDGGRGHRVAG